MSQTPGTRFGPYEIVSSVGAGGMGEVYRARDTRLGRDVAIKILPAALASDPQFRDRFEREARSISQLTHPHICTLYDVGEEPAPYLVMELLEGESQLRSEIQEFTLPQTGVRNPTASTFGQSIGTLIWIVCSISARGTWRTSSTESSNSKVPVQIRQASFTAPISRSGLGTVTTDTNRKAS